MIQNADLGEILQKTFEKALIERKPALQAYMELYNLSPFQVAESTGMTIGDLSKELELSRKYNVPSTLGLKDLPEKEKK
jgi:hypothetical protein